MKRSLLFLAALLALFAACNKTPDPQVDVITMLRSGKWKVNSGTVTLRQPNGVKADKTYYPDLRMTCLQDDYIIFDSSNIGKVYSNTTKCSGSDVDSANFVWVLKNNDKNMDIIGGYHIVDSVIYNIVSDPTSSTGYAVTYSPAVSRISELKNAKLTNVSDNAFTLEYTLYAQYLDTTGGNAGSPVVKPDTFTYKVTYTH